MCFQSETCVFNFLRRSVHGKHLLRFQSKTSDFKFLARSVEGAWDFGEFWNNFGGIILYNYNPIVINVPTKDQRMFELNKEFPFSFFNFIRILLVQAMICYAFYLLGLRQNSIVVVKTSFLDFMHANVWSYLNEAASTPPASYADKQT